MMLSNDSQQIYFDLTVNGIPQRRTFSGIIYLDTQSDRLDMNVPSDSLYFVIATCKFYYYYGNEWKQLSSGAIVFTTSNQMQSMTQCDPQKLYLDQTTSSLFYGINISGSVLWINLSKYDKISDYIGDVNIKIFNGSDYCNVISTQQNSTNVVIGNIDGQLKLLGSNIKYNGNNLNTANGLVKLNEDGKIPNNLIDIQISNQVYNDTYFETKTFSVQNLTNNQKSFTFTQLGIQQPTILQLLDDQDLIRDDVIPVYWTSTGVEINFAPIAQLLTQSGHIWNIKYMVAGKAVVNNIQVSSSVVQLQFSPYGLANNKKTFTYAQLNLTQKTIVQIINDQNIIMDHTVPMYWTQTGLVIDFSTVANLLTQQMVWKITYLATGGNINHQLFATKSYVDTKIQELLSQINN